MNIKVGQKVFLKLMRDEVLYPCVVIKVGRKYFEIETEDKSISYVTSRTKYDIETLSYIDYRGLTTQKIYLSDKEYYDTLRLEEVKRLVREKLFPTSYGSGDFPLMFWKKIYSVIEEENVQKET